MDNKVDFHIKMVLMVPMDMDNKVLMVGMDNSQAMVWVNHTTI
jgi:hypothetical protein